jgi:hypothetical protein
VKQVVNSTTSGTHTLLYRFEWCNYKPQKLFLEAISILIFFFSIFLLNRACRNGNSQIVSLLMEYGAIARPHYYTKYSPLYIACHMGNIEIARMILNVD